MCSVIMLLKRLKMWVALLLLATLAAAQEDLILPKIGNDSTNVDLNSYRLPTNAIPSFYNIRLNVPENALTGGNTTYEGLTIITFQVKQQTNNIVISSLVNITNLTISGVNILNHTVDNTKETVKIFTTENLIENVSYTMTVDYTATLDPVNMKGFYRSAYTHNGKKEYMGITQFESTDARRAFPCFDEPAFKAVFNLTLEYPEGFTAIANTPVARTVISNNSRVVTNFQETPLMSTYLLAFSISKFTCTETNDNSTGGIPYGVCSRPNLANERMFALDYGKQIMGALGTWFGYPYNSTGIGKIDQIAVPDFSAGAMENWGLVTYRESGLLYNQSYTSNAAKQSILTIISHEFTHMWFGDLVTCDWWDFTFLNEGFARYFQNFILTQIPSLQSYEFDKQIIIEAMHKAFNEDSLLSSLSLVSQSWTPAQIRQKFGSISYDKGASVLRMIEKVLGENVFQSALRKYLVTNAYKSTTPEILWRTFEQEVPNGTLPDGLNFTTVIENWSSKAGFPLVTVSLDGGKAVLSQKRFLITTNNTKDTTQWYIPITYMTPNGSVKGPLWLKPNSTLTIDGLNDTWFIINYNTSGYYRVKYPSSVYNKIAKVLRDNYRTISDINRAQILDDALNLAKAREIKYSEAFQLLNYLKNETCYYPWNVIVRNFNFLTARFELKSILGQSVANMMLKSLGDAKTNLSSVDLDSVSHKDSLKWPLIWATACRFGNEICVSEAKKQFKSLKNNNTSVNPNIRTIVYCNALRHSDDIKADWNYLWNRLHEIDQPQETMYILQGLGCTRDKNLLSFYLNQTVNASSIIRIQNLATVWSAVYSSSSEGLEVAFEKFITEADSILEYYSGAISILSGMTNAFTSNEQLIKLQAFADKYNANSTIGAAARSSIEGVKTNLEWQSSVREDLEGYFGIKSDGNSASYIMQIGIDTLLLVTMISVMIFT